MPQPTVPRAVLVLLMVVGLVLVTAVAAFAALAALVALMGDAAGWRGLAWVAVGLGGLFLVDLVCLVFALAWNAANESEGPTEDG
ncbi:MAG: hypothetical protein NUV77_20415 [Thermoguttaceae bacterium]|nr:hypothetical protein [Thermoguttaceae bacterium]